MRVLQTLALEVHAQLTIVKCAWRNRSLGGRLCQGVATDAYNASTDLCRPGAVVQGPTAPFVHMQLQSRAPSRILSSALRRRLARCLLVVGPINEVHVSMVSSMGGEKAPTNAHNRKCLRRS